MQWECRLLLIWIQIFYHVSKSKRSVIHETRQVNINKTELTLTEECDESEQGIEAVRKERYKDRFSRCYCRRRSSEKTAVLKKEWFFFRSRYSKKAVLKKKLGAGSIYWSLYILVESYTMFSFHIPIIASQLLSVFIHHSHWCLVSTSSSVLVLANFPFFMFNQLKDEQNFMCKISEATLIVSIRVKYIYFPLYPPTPMRTNNNWGYKSHFSPLSCVRESISNKPTSLFAFQLRLRTIPWWKS